MNEIVAVFALSVFLSLSLSLSLFSLSLSLSLSLYLVSMGRAVAVSAGIETSLWPSSTATMSLPIALLLGYACTLLLVRCLFTLFTLLII